MVNKKIDFCKEIIILFKSVKSKVTRETIGWMDTGETKSP
jgi:hypothetical protein